MYVSCSFSHLALYSYHSCACGSVLVDLLEPGLDGNHTVPVQFRTPTKTFETALLLFSVRFARGPVRYSVLLTSISILSCLRRETYQLLGDKSSFVMINSESEIRMQILHPRLPLYIRKCNLLSTVQSETRRFLSEKRSSEKWDRTVFTKCSSTDTSVTVFNPYFFSLF